MTLVEYIRSNVDMDEVRHTISMMEKTREPLFRVNPKLSDEIYDMAEEYGNDHDLPEGWWLEHDDEESILFKL